MSISRGINSHSNQPAVDLAIIFETPRESSLDRRVDVEKIKKLENKPKKVLRKEVNFTVHQGSRALSNATNQLQCTVLLCELSRSHKDHGLIYFWLCTQRMQHELVGQGSAWQFRVLYKIANRL